MERLLEATAVVSQTLPQHPPAKEIYLCPSKSIDELPDSLRPNSRYFGLLLLMDAREKADQTVFEAAEKILAKGLLYLCARGGDCERVHDLFDQSAMPINDELLDDNVVMTTSHSDESLHEAVWFFVNFAFPTEKFWRECSDWIIAPVGNPEWERQIRTNIKSWACQVPPDAEDGSM